MKTRRVAQLEEELRWIDDHLFGIGVDAAATRKVPRQHSNTRSKEAAADMRATRTQLAKSQDGRGSEEVQHLCQHSGLCEEARPGCPG
jgi:hypothetical protein